MCKIYGTIGRNQTGGKCEGPTNNEAGKANILEVNAHSEHWTICLTQKRAWNTRWTFAVISDVPQTINRWTVESEYRDTRWTVSESSPEQPSDLK